MAVAHQTWLGCDALPEFMSMMLAGLIWYGIDVGWLLSWRSLGQKQLRRANVLWLR